MLEIRKVSAEDKSIILEWRNNPSIYKYALNPTPVSVEDHEKWFTKILSSKSCYFYIGIFDKKKCGTVRYDLLESEAEAEVSISLAPEFWGKGLGFELMKMAEVELRKDSVVKTIHSTILNDNAASLSLFVKSDFRPQSVKLIKNI